MAEHTKLEAFDRSILRVIAQEGIDGLDDAYIVDYGASNTARWLARYGLAVQRTDGRWEATTDGVDALECHGG